MTKREDRCLFCRIANDEIPAKKVYDDSDVVAFEDINPQAPTHILVIPRRHIASLDALTAGDHEVIGRTMVKASEIARDHQLQNDGYRIVVNCGEGAGQTVFHVHFHLLGGRRFNWPPG
ncbi:MAG TPA: histidine triad nucleotide-binding protein [Thermoanaerobaculia bacterium]